MKSPVPGFLLALFLLNPISILNGQPSFDLQPPDQENPVPATTALSHNSIYLELLGPGLLYSLNYEYRFTEHISARAGLSVWSIDSLDLLVLQIKKFSYKSFPLMVNYMTGSRASHLEAGVGIMPLFVRGDFSVFYFLGESENNRVTAILGIATIGYRYQRRESGFIFRADATPVFNRSGIYVGFGLSLGYGF